MTEPLTLRDLTKVTRDPHSKDLRIDTPTLCACKCGGLSSLYVGTVAASNVTSSGMIEDPELAYQVALVRHGWDSHNWEGLYLPKKCECGPAVEAARAIVAKLTIANDTGWAYTSSACPRRGWHDYKRTVSFNRELTSEEEDAFRLVSFRDGPGAMGFSLQKAPASPRCYQLTTYTDSGD